VLSLVEEPFDIMNSASRLVGQLIIEMVGQVNGKVVASLALVTHGSTGCLASVLDGHLEAAEGVAVTLRTHQTMRKSDDVLSGTVSSGAAGSETGLIECDVACARATLGALAIGTATTGAACVGRCNLSLRLGSGA